MFLFLETIKIKDGRRMLLDRHQERMNRCMEQFFPGVKAISLDRSIRVPFEFRSGLVKCRVVYNDKIRGITFSPYNFSNPASFKVVNGDELEYRYKFADRKNLDLLYRQRGRADDIVIIKKGMVTDSYYANLIFQREGQWFTPDQPLLEGTMRADLINKGLITPLRITLEDLFSFEKIRIINAMTGFSMHEPVIINRDTIHL